MNRMIIALVLAPLAAVAQQADRNAFMRQQAYAEMQRVSGQVDVLQNNFDELQRRVGKLEGGGDINGLKAEIESLKSSVAELKRQMAGLRGEIVNDLSSKIAKIQKSEPAPQPAAPKKVVIGPHQEYTVQAGDTLTLISQAFGCSVKKIKEMNGLKSDSLRVGQKLMLPK